MKARIAVFVSGGGTNLQALIDAQKAGIIQSGEISLVISNNKDAYALQRAADNGIASEVVLKKECGSQEAFEAKLCQILEENKIDLIVLAGFMNSFAIITGFVILTCILIYLCRRRIIIQPLTRFLTNLIFDEQ